MPTVTFIKTARKVWTGQLSLSSGTLKLALLKAAGSWTPDPAQDEFMSTAAVDELTVGEVSTYARVALSGVTINETSNTITITSSDVSFGQLVAGTGATATRAVLFLDLGGADSANPLLAKFDFPGAGLAINGQSLTIAQPATAWWRSVWGAPSAAYRALTFADLEYVGSFDVQTPAGGDPFRPAAGMVVEAAGTHIWTSGSYAYDNTFTRYAIPAENTLTDTTPWLGAWPTTQAGFSPVKAQVDGPQRQDWVGPWKSAANHNSTSQAPSYYSWGAIEIGGQKYFTAAEYYLQSTAYHRNTARVGGTVASKIIHDGRLPGKPQGDSASLMAPGYLLELPSVYTSQYAGMGNIASGYTKVQGVSGSSAGPALFVYDTSDYESDTIAPVTALAYPVIDADGGQPRYPEGPKYRYQVWGNPNFGAGDFSNLNPDGYVVPEEYHGGAFIYGQKTNGENVWGFVFGGAHSKTAVSLGYTYKLQSFYYSSGGPGPDTGQGNHSAGGYAGVWHFYDPADIGQGFLGNTPPYEIFPTESISTDSPLKWMTGIYASGNADDGTPYAGTARNDCTGMAWCAATQRLYVQQNFAYGNGQVAWPIIDVWKLA